MAFSIAGFIPAFYVVASTVVVIVLVRIVLRTTARNLPPGPTGLPLIGSLHLLGALPHRNLAELAKKYGPLMSIRLGQAQFIIASSPETAMEFLKLQDANWCSRPRMLLGELLFDGGQDIGFQNNSPVWRQMIKHFRTELASPNRLEATRHVREEEIAYLIRTIPQNCEVELRIPVSVAVANIISRLVLNRCFIARAEETETEERMLEIKSLKEIMTDITGSAGLLYPGDFIPSLKWFDFQGLVSRYKSIKRRMDALATKIIAEHEARRKLGPVPEQEKDMVHVLLGEVEKAAGENQITMANIRGIIWDAFTAGSESTTITTEWIMSEVLRNPTVQAKAQAELDSVVGHNRLVQESDIPNLVYIQAIVKEGLRLHPPGPMLLPHQSINACKAFGYDIPADTRLMVNVWAIGRDGTLWPNPTEFSPGRFARDGPNAAIDTKGQNFELLPFGSGRRMCPGAGLGHLTVQFFVATLLHAFQWDVTADPGVVEAVDGVVLSRAVPLRVIAKPRLSSEFYN